MTALVSGKCKWDYCCWKLTFSSYCNCGNVIFIMWLYTCGLFVPLQGTSLTKVLFSLSPISLTKLSNLVSLVYLARSSVLIHLAHTNGSDPHVFTSFPILPYKACLADPVAKLGCTEPCRIQVDKAMSWHWPHCKIIDFYRILFHIRVIKQTSQ